MSQILTGHGRFPHYLFSFRIRRNRTCPCNLEEIDLDHYFINCKLTKNYRTQLKKHCKDLMQRKYELIENVQAVAVLERMVDTINSKV